MLNHTIVYKTHVFYVSTLLHLSDERLLLHSVALPHLFLVQIAEIVDLRKSWMVFGLHFVLNLNLKSGWADSVASPFGDRGSCILRIVAYFSL